MSYFIMMSSTIKCILSGSPAVIIPVQKKNSYIFKISILIQEMNSFTMDGFLIRPGLYKNMQVLRHIYCRYNSLKNNIL